MIKHATGQCTYTARTTDSPVTDLEPIPSPSLSLKDLKDAGSWGQQNCGV